MPRQQVWTWFHNSRSHGRFLSRWAVWSELYSRETTWKAVWGTISSTGERERKNKLERGRKCQLWKPWGFNQRELEFRPKNRAVVISLQVFHLYTKREWNNRKACKEKRRASNSIREGNGTPLQYSCWKIPWTEEPGRLQSMGSLKSDTTEWLHFHALEKEMATHSSILAWRVPGTEELGGLLPTGSHNRPRLKWLSSSSNSILWECLYSWGWRTKQKNQRREVDCEDISWSLSNNTFQTSVTISWPAKASFLVLFIITLFWVPGCCQRRSCSNAVVPLEVLSLQGHSSHSNAFKSGL